MLHGFPRGKMGAQMLDLHSYIPAHFNAVSVMCLLWGMYMYMTFV